MARPRRQINGTSTPCSSGHKHHDGALGDRVTVGIADYAQEQLSEIVHVHLPAVGTAVTGGEPNRRGRVHQVGVRPLQPDGGTVVAGNDTLDKRPELPNADPYGQSWMIAVQMTDPASSTS